MLMTERRLSDGSSAPASRHYGGAASLLRRIPRWTGVPVIVILMSVLLTAGAPTGSAPPGQISPEKRAASHPQKKNRAPRVQMSPSSRKAGVGQTLTVRVRISNGADVGSVPFHVVYNPQVLEFESGEEGSFLNRDSAKTAFFAAPMSSPGEIVVGLSRLGSGEGANGGGVLCLLRFRVLARGDAGLAFQKASVKDPRNKILAGDFQPARVRAR